MESGSHLEEGKILQHLLQEVQDSSTAVISGDRLKESTSNDKVQSMVEKYRTHVIKQQQKKLSSGVTCLKQVRACLPTIKYQPNGAANAPLMSHSQPCLFSVAEQRADQKNNILHIQHSSDPKEDSFVVKCLGLLQNSADTTDIVLLQNEIISLKHKVEILQNKSDKLKQLEMAYGKIEQEFEQVITQRKKHEKLEKTVYEKMEQQIQRLTQENVFLKMENERGLSAAMSESNKLQDTNSGENGSSIDNRQQKIVDLNMVLSDLIPQNKKLMEIEERQRIELDAQTSTLDEQRTHIDMLEKALSNAQDRLQAKDRQTLDAVAVMDKCVHLQKLLQESLDEKQKYQDNHNKQKAQMEMELAQLRMQISKDTSSFGPRKGPKLPESEEVTKLKKLIYNKDERISQLESSLLNIQKRYSDELQRNVPDTSSETLLTTLRSLESDNAKKEQKIQNLLDEKQRIHNQWAEERRSLDHRVRILERDLKILMIGNNSTLSIISPSYGNVGMLNSGSNINTFSFEAGNWNSLFHNYRYQPSRFYSGTSACSQSSSSSVEGAFEVNTDFNSVMSSSVTEFNGFNNIDGSFINNDGSVMLRQRSSTDLPNNSRAAIIHDSTYTRMEELRRKIADRRASATSGSSNSSLTGNIGYGVNLNISSKRVSKHSLESKSIENVLKPTSKNNSNLSRHLSKQKSNINLQHDQFSQHKMEEKANHEKSPRTSLMGSHFLDSFSRYVDALPPFTRRKFVASERVILRKPNTILRKPNTSPSKNAQNILVHHENVVMQTSTTSSEKVIGESLSFNQALSVLPLESCHLGTNKNIVDDGYEKSKTKSQQKKDSNVGIVNIGMNNGLCSSKVKVNNGEKFANSSFKTPAHDLNQNSLIVMRKSSLRNQVDKINILGVPGSNVFAVNNKANNANDFLFLSSFVTERDNTNDNLSNSSLISFVS